MHGLQRTVHSGRKINKKHWIYRNILPKVRCFYFGFIGWKIKVYGEIGGKVRNNRIGSKLV